MEKNNAAGNRILRIAIVGPECSGKSTLAEFLAKQYQTYFVPEAAREYLSKLERKYTLEDIEKISKLQMESESELEKKANKFLFCDTNLLVTKVWAEHVFGKSTGWIDEHLAKKKYDLHLLTMPDLPWQPDPLRENPSQEERQEIFLKYMDLLWQMQTDYEIIKGNGIERAQCAVRSVEKFYFR